MKEGGEARGKGLEEVFAFLWSGMTRKADVSRDGSVSGDPSAVGGLESEVEGDVFELRGGGDPFGVDALDHGSFPFAGMAHLALEEALTFWGKRCGRSMIPVGGEEQKKIALGTMTLAQFEGGLFSGYGVAAVAVDEDDAFEAVGEEILG